MKWLTDLIIISLLFIVLGLVGHLMFELLDSLLTLKGI